MADQKEVKATPTSAEETATPKAAPQILKTGGTPDGPTYLSSLVNPSWPSAHLMVQKKDEDDGTD